MAEDLTVQAGLTDYIIILWYTNLCSYEFSSPLNFQTLADAENGPDFILGPFPTIEAIQVKNRENCITGTLENCRRNWSLIEKSDIPFPTPIAHNQYILTGRGIRRIKSYISESNLPYKAGLLKECESLGKLMVSLRESPITDTIATIVTPYPDKEDGENFLLPESPLTGIGFLSVSAITRANFIRYCGGLDSSLARMVASQIRAPRKERSWLFNLIEQDLNNRLAPYLLFGEPAAGSAEESPARDAAPDAAATGEAGLDFPPGFEVVERGTKSNDQGDKQPKPMTDATLKQFIQKVLPYINEIGATEAQSKRWGTVRGTPHPGRHENAVIKNNGIMYDIFYDKTQEEFNVRLCKAPNGEKGKPRYFKLYRQR